MARNKLAVLALGSLGLLITACASAPSSTYVPAACASFGEAFAALDAGVSCGWLTVPESRASGSRLLQIPVVTAAATGPVRGVPILYVHGGPGIATLDVVPRALAGKSWPLLRASHDLVFFDQRGTGRSRPALCPDHEPALARSADPLEARIVAASRCREAIVETGGDPGAYGSRAIAEDIEALRKALGLERWSVFATSFGSFPAAALVRANPLTVEALLLDSAFPPNSPNRAEQISATAEAIAAIQERCHQEVACARRYPDIRSDIAQAIGRLERKPLVHREGRIDGEAFAEAMWVALVDGSTVAFVPEIASRASRGDDRFIRRFVRAFGGSDHFGGMSFAQQFLVNCRDVFPLPTDSATRRAVAAHPDLASGVTAGEVDRICATMQSEREDASFYAPLDTDVPVLVFAGEFDPATPLSDARAAMAGLKRGTLAVVPGASHAPFYTDDCTRGIGAAFFNEPASAVDLACMDTMPPVRFEDDEAFALFEASLPE